MTLITQGLGGGGGVAMEVQQTIVGNVSATAVTGTLAPTLTIAGGLAAGAIAGFVAPDAPISGTVITDEIKGEAN